MKMTKDERNKRRSDLRFQEHSARYQSLKHTIIHLWQGALKSI